jgi:hypothetical protein
MMVCTPAARMMLGLSIPANVKKNADLDGG